MNLSCDALLPISSALPRFSLTVLYPSSSFTSLCPANNKDAEQPPEDYIYRLGLAVWMLVEFADDVLMNLLAK